jgi:hypothetical protein
MRKLTEKQFSMTRNLERVDLLEVDLSSVPVDRLLKMWMSVAEVNMDQRKIFTMNPWKERKRNERRIYFAFESNA